MGEFNTGRDGSRSGGKSRESSNGERRTGSSYSPARRAEERRRQEAIEAERAKIVRERRIKKYKKQSGLRKFAMYAAIATAIVTIFLTLSITILFNIEEIAIEINGELPYTQEEILMRSGLELGQNMFTPAVFGSMDSLKAQMPYIEECRLKRTLPSKVTIVVEAAEILGLLEDERGISYVVSTSGRMLEITTIETNTSSLTKISGITVVGESAQGAAVSVDNDSRLETAIMLTELFAQENMHLDWISFSSSGEISAMYDNRLEIVFGLPTDLKNKVELATSLILSGSIAPRESGRITLTIGNETMAIFTPDYLL